MVCRKGTTQVSIWHDRGHQYLKVLASCTGHQRTYRMHRHSGVIEYFKHLQALPSAPADCTRLYHFAPAGHQLLPRPLPLSRAPEGPGHSDCAMLYLCYMESSSRPQGPSGLLLSLHGSLLTALLNACQSPSPGRRLRMPAQVLPRTCLVRIV